MNENLIKTIDLSINFFTHHLEFLRKMNEMNKSYKIDFKPISDRIDIDEFDCLKNLNDVYSLITISHLDSLVAIKYLYNASNNWDKIFFIKNSYLTIFETLKTYEIYRKFLYEISTIKHADLQDELKSVNLDIRNFKNEKFFAEISLIRNEIAGHISGNFELYYDTIVKFDAEETAKIVLKFTKIIEKLENFLSKTMMKEKVNKKKFDNLIEDTQEKIEIILKKLSNI